VSPNVTSLAQISQGIYWIALNEGGLYRYDPRMITEIARPTQREPTSDDYRVTLNAQLVSHDYFSTLHEDRQGRLWAANEGLWLVEEARGQVTFRRVELNLSETSKGFGISTIVDSQDGSLWLGTSQGLIRRLPDGRTVSSIVHPEGPFDVVTSLAGRPRRKNVDRP
jgi:ligand-binding sensor domain-containing protein